MNQYEVLYGTLGLLAVVWAVWRFRPWCWKPFINKTSLTDAQIEQAWVSAQQVIAKQAFPLNPGPAGSGTPESQEDMHPADSAAETVHPRAIKVVEKADARKDVSGFVGPWNQPGFYDGLSYFGWYRPTTVKIAKSVAANVLVYEFQNVILHMLGYNTENR